MENQPVGVNPAPPTDGNDVVSTVVPYKNPAALIGYYLAVFSIIGFFPVLGLIGSFMGIAAFFLGLKGLQNVKKYPYMKGTAHAWIGILVGGFFGLVTLAWNALIIAAILSRH
jgi:hypothetical protein